MADPTEDVPEITDDLVDDVIAPHLLDVARSLTHAGRSWPQAFADLHRAVDLLEQHYQTEHADVMANADPAPG